MTQNIGISGLSLPLAALLLLGLVLQGCASGHSSANTVASSTWSVYSREAPQGRSSTEIPLEASRVYQAMLQTLQSLGEFRVTDTDPSRGTVTMYDTDIQLVAQATDTRHGTTLLLIWVDTGTSGKPANDLLQKSVNAICRDLDVVCNPRGK